MLGLVGSAKIDLLPNALEPNSISSLKKPTTLPFNISFATIVNKTSNLSK